MRTRTMLAASFVVAMVSVTAGTGTEGQSQTNRRLPSVADALARPAYAWAKTWGGTNEDAGGAAAVDSSGNVYIVGSFVGTVDFDPDPTKSDLHTSVNGTIDAFLAKFSADGTFQWAKTWGAGVGGSILAGRDVANGVAVDHQGHVLVTGNFQYTVDFNPAGGASRASNSGSMNNAFLSKFAPDGSFEWVQTWGPADGGAEGYSVAVDTADNAYVVGDFSGSGAYFDNTIGQTPSDWHANHAPAADHPRMFDAYLAKYDSSGHFVWAKTWGGEGYDDGPGVAVDSLNNVYVAGMYASQHIDFDPAGSGVTDHPAHDDWYTTDVFLSKFDSDGVFKWVRTWGGTAGDEGVTVAVDAANNVYAGGRLSSTDCDFNPGGSPDVRATNGGSDAFIAKYGPSGNFIWARTWGGTGDDAGGGLATDGANNVYSGGSFSAVVQFAPAVGSISLTSNGAKDAFLAKLDADGTFQWAYGWGGAGDDWSNRPTVEGWTALYVPGKFASTVDMDPTSGTDTRTSGGAGDASVTKFSFVLAPPTLSTVTPSGGTTAGGTIVTISGSGFFGNVGVTFDGLAATGVTIVSESRLTALAPAHAAGLVAVGVTTGGGGASIPGAYSYVAPVSFTDSPIVPRVTPVRAIHATELRNAIASIRTRYGLSAFPWTNGALSPPGTVAVKRQDIVELRAALAAVYASAGRTPPVYTDASLVAGVTVIATAHIAELRSAVLAIW